MAFEQRKNLNRGYRKLNVWTDAIQYYVITCEIYREFRPPLHRVAAQQIASVDSIHRNIAEGYCRRSSREYLQFLNVALASAGESVSGLHACRQAAQLSDADFDRPDALAFKLEDALKRLIEGLQRKKGDGTWSESFIVKGSNVAYGRKKDEWPSGMSGLKGEWGEFDG